MRETNPPPLSHVGPTDLRAGDRVRVEVDACVAIGHQPVTGRSRAGPADWAALIELQISPLPNSSQTLAWFLLAHRSEMQPQEQYVTRCQVAIQPKLAYPLQLALQHPMVACERILPHSLPVGSQRAINVITF